MDERQKKGGRGERENGGKRRKREIEGKAGGENSGEEKMELRRDRFRQRINSFSKTTRLFLKTYRPIRIRGRP